jgi:hypothetical protein
MNKLSLFLAFALMLSANSFAKERRPTSTENKILVGGSANGKAKISHECSLEGNSKTNKLEKDKAIENCFKKAKKKNKKNK